MASIKVLFALIKKECWELLRDKRSLVATFAYALVGPFLLYVLIKGFIVTTTQETEVNVGLQTDARYEQSVRQIQHYLTTQNISVVNYSGELPTDFDQLPADKGFDALIRVEPPMGADGGERMVIAVYGDQGSQGRSKQLEKTVELVSQFVTNQRQDDLIKQGLNPSSSQWQVEKRVINEQTQSTNRLMDTLLIFLLLAPFFITLNYINDATAGERERGSLMPLLTQPMSRDLLIASKWSVGSLLGIVGSLVTMLIGFTLIVDLPVYEIGLQLNPSAVNAVLTMAIITPLALCIASVQMLIAFSAKSFKEGQSYLTLFSFIPLIAVFMADKFDDASWSAMTPLLGHQQMLKSVFVNQEVDNAQFIGLTISCILITSIALLAVRKQLNSEGVLQGR